jgi:hypothetical protein
LAVSSPGNKQLGSFFSQRHREHRGELFSTGLTGFPTASLQGGEMIGLVGSEF